MLHVCLQPSYHGFLIVANVTHLEGARNAETDTERNKQTAAHCFTQAHRFF